MKRVQPSWRLTHTRHRQRGRWRAQMTCTCGAAMCYICRQPIGPEGYKHFCQHMHEHGTCPENCGRCYLYTNAEQDDLMAIEEERAKAERELPPVERAAGRAPAAGAAAATAAAH